MPFYLPDYKIVNYALTQNTTVASTASAFTQQQQTFRYFGQTWSLTGAIPPLKRDRISRWHAFFSLLEGSYDTFYFCPINERFPIGRKIIGPELIAAPAVNSTAGAFESFSTFGQESVLVRRTGTSGTRLVGWNLTGLTSGVRYVFSFCLRQIEGLPFTSSNLRAGIGSTSSTTLSSETAITRDGMHVFSFVTTGTTQYFAVRLDTGFVGACSFELSLPSVRRVFTSNLLQTVSGTVRTNSLSFSGLPASSTSVLTAGDFIELSNGQLVMLTSSADSNGSGAATATCFPYLRSTLSSGTAQLVCPTGQFRLTGNSVSHGERSADGTYSGLSFQATENVI